MFSPSYFAALLQPSDLGRADSFRRNRTGQIGDSTVIVIEITHGKLATDRAPHFPRSLKQEPRYLVARIATAPKARYLLPGYLGDAILCTASPESEAFGQMQLNSSVVKKVV